MCMGVSGPSAFVVLHSNVVMGWVAKILPGLAEMDRVHGGGNCIYSSKDLAAKSHKAFIVRKCQDENRRADIRNFM